MDKDPEHRPPQPQRFQKYYEVKDGSGFMIDGCDHFFKFDKYGGWFDQYKNYYNADGEPDNEPEYSDGDEDDEQWSYGNDSQDEYEKLYGPNATHEEDQQEHQSKQVLQKIAKNMVILAKHDQKQLLRVNFQILDRKRAEQKEQKQEKQEEQEPLPEIMEIVRAFRKKSIEVITAFYDEDLKQKDSGWIIVKNAKEAEKLINLEGVNLTGFDFTFDVQTLEEQLADPLDEDEKQEFEIEQKYVIKEEEHKYFAFLIDGKGLTCKKQKLKEWFKQKNIKLVIIKMKKGSDGKIPIILLKSKEVEILTGAQFEGGKVTLEQFKMIEKEEEEKDEEKKVEEKQEKVQPQ